MKQKIPYSKLIAEFEKRNRAIIKMRLKGISFNRIAVKFGLSRQRIEQVCKKGIPQ